jgi:hypothetical protein
VVQDVTIANVRAKGSVADPPLLMLELLDGNGAVLGEQHAWHPLWATDWDDTGTQEAGQTLASGTGTFYVPLSETLAAVRITDMVLAQELTTADVSTQVGEYCSAHPLSVICGGPGEPTTTSTTTTTVTSTTTSTTLASGGACGDPVGSAGSLTARISTTTINASDALFTLRAGVGSEACELCVCDVDDSGEVNSSDALGILKFGVGQPVVLNCPTCAAGGG